jgi:hypothetical protein
MMSTNPEPTSQYEAKNIELILKIIQKTVEGKVEWTRRQAKLSASLPNGLIAEFVIPASAPLTFGFLRGFTPENWSSFQIKDEKDNSLVAIQNEGVLVNALRSGSNAVAAAEALFQAIIKLDTLKLDKAINAVDKL